MRVHHSCVTMVMASGLLLFTAGAVQAQLGAGSSSGGPGGPDITRPGKGGDALQDGAGSLDGSSESMNPGHDSSAGRMGQESAGQPRSDPHTRGESHRGGSGKTSDPNTTNSGIGAAGGSDAGAGSGTGSMGSSGGTGSGGR